MMRNAGASGRPPAAPREEGEGHLRKDRSAEETCDELLHGRLRLFQHRHGYRFSLDPLLLAHFFRVERLSRIADLGTGCGVIPLLLALRAPALAITGYEVQRALCELARRNVEANGFSGRIEIEETDLRRIVKARPPFDGVVTNPPYLPAGGGMVSANRERAVARHEIIGTLDDFLDAAQRLLRNGGRFGCIYPADRAVALLERLRRRRLEPKRLRFVHPRPEAPARLLLVEALKHRKGGGLEILSPLFLHDGAQRYTEEAEKILSFSGLLPEPGSHGEARGRR